MRSPLLLSAPDRPAGTAVVAVLGGLFAGCSVAVAGSTAFVALLTGAIAVPLAVLVYRFPWVGVGLVFLAVLPGQFIRFSLGTDARGGAAILLTDLALPLAVVAWLARRWGSTEPIPQSRVAAPLALFAGVALLSLVAGMAHAAFFADAPGKPAIIATMYWARFVLYGCFLFVAREALRSHADRLRLVWMIVGTTVALALIGFVQLWLIPDFTAYAHAAGWDPHQGRLLSSFFDPNFMGTYFAMVLALLLALLLDPSRSMRAKLLLALAGSIILVAFLLTYSRGALLGLAAAFALVTLLRAPRLFVAGMIGLTLLIGAVPRFAERITEGLSIDETGVKRIESWTTAVKLVAAYPVLGTGYNHLATVQGRLGLVDEFDVNNRGGFENSLLTVAATTGITGLLAYLLFLASMFLASFGQWADRARPPEARHLGLGVGGALVAALVASTTINGLFYPAILILLMAMIALVEAAPTVADVRSLKLR